MKERKKSETPLMKMKKLFPIVRGLHSPTEVPVQVLLEYAESLLELHGTPEALALLTQERQDWPLRRLFLLGYACFQNLEFEKASSYFNDFLASGPSAPADIVLAKESLARCYRLLGRFDDALDLIESEPMLRKERAFTLLVKNCFATSGNTHAVDRLREHQAKFFVGGEFESLRETEFYLAMVTDDAYLKTKLFYGSPSASFRDRIRQASPSSFVLPDTFLVKSREIERPERIFHLAIGIEDLNARVTLKVGQAVHRLLSGLLSDSYRPLTLVAAFHVIFREEVFDPNTSPMRVHQIVKRLKSWFLDNEIPARVVEKKSAYSLEIAGDYSFLLERRHLDLSKVPPLLARLTLLIPEERFTIRAASAALGLSPRFTRKLLVRAKEKGWIEVSKRGTRTTYAFLERGRNLA